jgi:hypothetical protein
MVAVVLSTVCGCASTYTSVQRESDGHYVLTGAKVVPFVGPVGFVEIGNYDPKTKTMTVTQSLP